MTAAELESDFDAVFEWLDGAEPRVVEGSDAGPGYLCNPAAMPDRG